MKTGMALPEKSVRNAIFSQDDTVSFNLEKWNTRRRLSLSMWGDKEVVGEMGKKMNCE